jgi:uncharacterized protein (DUF58 family)
MAIAVLLLVALLAAYLQNRIFGKWALSSIRYTRSFHVQECYAGDQIEMVEVIENHKLLPVFWLRVESTIDASLRFHTEETLDIHEGRRTQYHKSLFTLGPYRRIRRTHKVICAQRGVYRLDTVSVSAGDLFGLSENQRSFPVSTAVTVYPQVIDIEDVPLPAHGWQGDVSVRRWIVEDPFMIAGVRNYVSGDPMNRIHWKATARTGEMQVYKHDYTAEQRLVVYLNIEDKDTIKGLVHNEEWIEKGISYAATIISDVISQGISVGFGHNGYRLDHPDLDVRLPIGGGRAHLLAVLTEMSNIELRCKLRFHDYLEEDTLFTEERRDYLLITTHLSTEVQTRIEQLKRIGHSVQTLFIMDQPEKSALEETV